MKKGEAVKEQQAVVSEMESLATNSITSSACKRFTKTCLLGQGRTTYLLVVGNFQGCIWGGGGGGGGGDRGAIF